MCRRTAKASRAPPGVRRAMVIVVSGGYVCIALSAATKPLPCLLVLAGRLGNWILDRVSHCRARAGLVWATGYPR